MLASRLFGDDTPLERRALIDTTSATSVFSNNLISFNHILKTGEIPTYTKLHVALSEHENQSINWNADDALMRAMNEVEERTAAAIQRSPELQHLLQERDTWTKEDRTSWERGVSEIVSAEMDKIPGLGEYRSTDKKFSGHGNITRTSSLNDLSHDIENGTANYEFDCEQGSLIEGLILQKTDSRFLPETSDANDYKHSTNYFYVTGGNINTYGSIGLHAFIMSPATGNIIEAVQDPSAPNHDPYTRSLDPNFSFQDFVDGRPLVTVNGRTYHSTEITRETIEQRNLAIENATHGYFDKISKNNNTEKDYLSPTQHDSAPPEVQALLEIKNAINSGGNPEKYRGMFSKEIQDLAQNGQLQNVIDWLQKHPDNALSQNIKIDRSITDNAGPTSTQTTKITLQF